MLIFKNLVVMNTTGYSLFRVSGGYAWRPCLFKAGILFRPWKEYKKMPQPTVEKNGGEIL